MEWGNSMVWLLLLVAVIWFSIFLSKKLSFKFELSPKTVDIKAIKGLKNISNHLEDSLKLSYMNDVEERVRREIRLKENEYEWRLVDLKRYFIFTALLKEAPMFSEKVDELWHQMLMFTREYDEFSRKYLGNTLHHSPNVKGKSNPDLRGFFDWLYAELFYIRKENIHLYKGFFRHPVNPSVIEEFKNLPEDILVEKYFKSDTPYTKTVQSLISSMKKTVNQINNSDRSAIQAKMKKSKKEENYNKMLVPFLSVSYFHYDEFESFMNISKDNTTSSCTSCGSGHSCKSHSCSSDSSCSSCSSCSGGGD